MELKRVENIADAARAGASFGFSTAMGYAIDQLLAAARAAKDERTGAVATALASLLHKGRQKAHDEFISSFNVDVVNNVQ